MKSLQEKRLRQDGASQFENSPTQIEDDESCHADPDLKAEPNQTAVAISDGAPQAW